MIWKIIIYLSGGVNVILIYYFLRRIFKKDIAKYKILENNSEGIVLTFLLGLAAMNIFIVKFLRDDNFYILIFALLISSVVYHYILDIDLITTIRYVILAYLIMGLIKIVAATLITLIFRAEPALLFEENIYKALRIVITHISFYIFVKKHSENMKTPIISKYREKIYIFVGLLNAFIIYMAYIVFKGLRTNNIIDLIHLLGLATCSIIVTIVLYKIGKEIAQQEQRELILKSREEFLNKSDFYLESMEEILLTIRRQSHDLNNNLGTLYGLIYMEKFERAKEYIKKMNVEIKDMSATIDTNNPALTAMLTLKKNKSYQKAIEMNIDVDFPEEIEVDYIDMSIIMGNLLDNAIEACEKVDKEAKREINVNIYLKEGTLYIIVDNNKIPDKKRETAEFISRFTTKNDGENHGFGIGNVKMIVNKYNGEMEMEDGGDTFETKIKIPLAKEVLSK